ncbi:MAG TPA: hypothetical protein VI322_01705 [Candidatus Saccharimonadia bacterium]
MKFPARYAAIAIASLSLSGVALADTSAMAYGPDSSNYIKQSSRTNVSETNLNPVLVDNSNRQWAESGSVSARGNTWVGGLMSGDATNLNHTSTAVNIDNGGGAAWAPMAWPRSGVIEANAVGPDSQNFIHENNDVNVRRMNVNFVNVDNTNNQYARSGDVSASHNTSVGGLSSGDAMNSNRTGTSVSISN